MTVDVVDARHGRHPFAIGLVLAMKAPGRCGAIGLGPLAGLLSQRFLTHHHALAIEGQHLHGFGGGLPLDFLWTGLGIKGVKILGCRRDDLLNLTFANAYTGFGFDVACHAFKGHLCRLGRHAFLQAMRVALGGQIQLRIAWKQARHPALAITGTGHSNRTKHALIAGLHVIALVGAHHAVRAANDFCDSTAALIIQMLLEQQSQKFSPIGLQIGLNFTMGLVAL